MSAFASLVSNVSALKNKASEATAKLESLKSEGTTQINNAVSGVVHTTPPSVQSSEPLPPTVTATVSQSLTPSGTPPPDGGSPVVKPASQSPEPSGDKPPSISAGIDAAIKNVKEGEQKDEYCGEMTKAFISAFGKILENGNELPERALLAEFIQKQIKDYEVTLIPAIAKSLQISAQSQQYFLKKLGKAMDMKKKVGGGGGKAQSKKKLSKKKRKTRRQM